MKIKIDLVIQVPRQSTLEINTITAPIDIDNVEGDGHDLETVSGSITISNTSGEFEIQSVTGRIIVEDADSDVEVGTVSGSIEVSGNPRTVEAESISGRITLTGVQRRVSAETISGKVTIEARELSRLTLESISGSLNFEGGLSDDVEVDISSLSGAVRLTLRRWCRHPYRILQRQHSNL